MSTQDDLLEKKLETLLFQSVRSRLGGRAIKMMPTVAGIPDRCVFLPGGRVVFIELKRTKGVPSPIQRLRHAELAALGTHVVVVAGAKGIHAWVSAEAERARRGLGVESVREQAAAGVERRGQ